MAKRFSEEQVQERHQRMLVYRQSKIVFQPVSGSKRSLDAKAKTIKLDIKCTLDMGKGDIYFGYSFSNQGPSRVEFYTRCSDFLQLGRTAGRTYSFIPMDGVRSEIVGTYWADVFNEEIVNEIRGSASELPDKLREVLGL